MKRKTGGTVPDTMASADSCLQFPSHPASRRCRCSWLAIPAIRACGGFSPPGSRRAWHTRKAPRAIGGRPRRSGRRRRWGGRPANRSLMIRRWQAGLQQSNRYNQAAIRAFPGTPLEGPAVPPATGATLRGNSSPSFSGVLEVCEDAQGAACRSVRR